MARIEKLSCKNCNLKGDSKLSRAGKAIVECLLFNRWYKSSYSCIHWQQYMPGLSREERIRLTGHLEEKRKRYEHFLKDAVRSSLTLMLYISLVVLIILILLLLCKHMVDIIS